MSRSTLCMRKSGAFCSHWRAYRHNWIALNVCHPSLLRQPSDQLWPLIRSPLDLIVILIVPEVSQEYRSVQGTCNLIINIMIIIYSRCHGNIEGEWGCCRWPRSNCTSFRGGLFLSFLQGFYVLAGNYFPLLWKDYNSWAKTGAGALKPSHCLIFLLSVAGGCAGGSEVCVSPDKWVRALIKGPYWKTL